MGNPPLTRNQIRGFWAAWGGWALDGMDSFIYALVLDHGPLPGARFLYSFAQNFKERPDFASRLLSHLLMRAVSSPRHPTRTAILCGGFEGDVNNIVQVGLHDRGSHPGARIQRIDLRLQPTASASAVLR